MNKRGIKREILVVLLVMFVVINVFYVSAGELRVTMEHPFLIDGSWIDAKELVVGDLMMTIDGKLARITGIKDVKLKTPVKVYNLEASVYHDFVVGRDKLVVHNSNQRTIGQWKNYEPRRPLDVVEGYIDSERISFAEELIGPITPEERIAILEAHIVDNLVTKYRILENVGLNSYQINLLLRNKVSGTEIVKSGTFFSRFSREIEIIDKYNKKNRKAGLNCLEETSTEYRDAINTILKDPKLDNYLIQISKEFRDLSTRDNWYALDDTLQEAKMGMYNAIGTWDPEKGEFVTYMGIYIRGNMLRGLAKTGQISGTQLSGSMGQRVIYKLLLDIIEENPKATRSELLGILKRNHGEEFSPQTFETVIEKYFQRKVVATSGDAPIKIGSDMTIRDFHVSEELGGLELMLKKLDQDVYQKIIIELDGDFGRWVPIGSDKNHIMIGYGGGTLGGIKYSRYVLYIKETGDIIKADYILYDDLRGILLIEKNARYKTPGGNDARRRGDFQVINLNKYIGDFKKGKLRVGFKREKSINLYKQSTNLPGHVFNSKSGTLYVRMGKNNPSNYCGFTEIKDFIYDVDKGLIVFKYNKKYYAIRVLGISSKVPMTLRSLIGITDGRVFYDISKNKMIIIKKTGTSGNPVDVFEPTIEFYSDIYGIDSRVVAFKDSSGVPKYYINGGSSAKKFNKNSEIYQTIFNKDLKQVLVYSVTSNDYVILPVEFYDMGKNMLFYKNEGIWYAHWVQKYIGVRQQLPYRFSTMKYNRLDNHLKIGTEFIDEFGQKRVYNSVTEVFEIVE